MDAKPEDQTTVAMPRAVTERSGDTIGSFKLLQEIGEGGFGIVYMAEQRQPIKRKVALKIIKPGMDTREVIARFEAERQALALMDHPNIAKVLDAGETGTGRPYFVMELVKGVALTDYCNDNRLDTDQRLNLFRSVCAAVQHAHQKGVIHRDLKPANIMVTLHDAVPVIKVIDFGIAKAISQELTEKTLFTAFGQMIGTPQYMSPEQSEMSGLDVDTRSDIYSLGVVLYELLTGKTPLDPKQLRQAGLDEINRLIQEEEPMKPSTKLSTLGQDEIVTVSKAHNLQKGGLTRKLKGDLDWIVLKALEKDRNRRYQTALGLAEDVQRYLRDESVLASPPSVSYRLRKFTRRNRSAIATATVIATSLIAATGISLWKAAEAKRASEREAVQRKLAQERSSESRAVLKFFQEKVLAAARPKNQGGGLGVDVTVRDAIDQAASEVGETFQDQPKVEVLIRNTLGYTYRYLGEPDKARPQFEKALKYSRKEYGSDDAFTVQLLSNLAIAHGMAGHQEECMKLHEEALEMGRKGLGDEHPATLTAIGNLAVCYGKWGRSKDAVALREEALRLKRKVLGHEHPETLLALNNLANCYRGLGKKEEALEMMTEAYQLYQKKLGDEHPDTLRSFSNLASYYRRLGQNEKALEMTEKSLRLHQEVLGPKHPKTMQVMSSLSICYSDSERHDEAISLAERAADLATKVLGPGHIDTLSCLCQLAHSYRDADRLDEAETVYRKVIAAWKNQKFALWKRSNAKSSLGNVLTEKKQFAEAEVFLKEGYAEVKASPPQDPKWESLAVAYLWKLYLDWEKPDEAAIWREKWDELKAQ